MKRTLKNTAALIFTFNILLGCSLKAQTISYRNVSWEREKIAPGLVWISSHIKVNDSVWQNINLLKVNLYKRKLSLFYNPEKNIPVSQQAKEAKALAAVNAGFFNMLASGSVTYIRTGGLILDPDTAAVFKRNVNMTGALLIDRKGKVEIDFARINSWYDDHPEYIDVLVTGPLLIRKREAVVLPATSFSENSHPRTAIGRKGARRVFLVTVDGRTTQAKGMTLEELTYLMKCLKCRDAVNLDGGGSTTMWISGKPCNGVVNMPSDNKKFDHEGERAVSDVIIVR